MARTALQTAQANWGTASLIIGGGGVAAVSTVAGTVLGISPIGWAAIGVAVLGAAILTSDTTGKTIEVTVGSQSKDNGQVLVDLAGNVVKGTVAGTATYYSLAPANGGVYGYIAGTPSDFNVSLPGTGTGALATSRLHAWIAAHYNIPSSWVPVSSSTLAAGFTPSNNTYSTGKCPSYVPYCVVAGFTVTTKSGLESNFVNNLPPWAVGAWTYGTAANGNPYSGFAIMIPLSQLDNTPAFSCADDSSYDYISNTCLLKVAPADMANDAKCNISWGPDGCPVYNHNDPDCASLSTNFTCGTATVPPSITIKNPVTGESMTVARPTLSTQGTPGQVTVTQSTPDPTTNTTTIKTSVLNGPLSSTTDPSTGQTVAPSPPVSQGAQQQVAPGTGSAQAAPAAAVNVLNWPSTIQTTVTNFPTEMKCSNCAPAIDMLIPTDAPAAAPGVDPTVQDQASKFMDPIKGKFAGFFNFQLPAHAAGTCPAMNFHWDAWALKFDLSNNSMCEFLEQNRSTIQSVINVVAVIGAIIIVLGA